VDIRDYHRDLVDCRAQLHMARARIEELGREADRLRGRIEADERTAVPDPGRRLDSPR
jgi:hypothetical protein